VALFLGVTVSRTGATLSSALAALPDPPPPSSRPAPPSPRPSANSPAPARARTTTTAPPSGATGRGPAGRRQRVIARVYRAAVAWRPHWAPTSPAPAGGAPEREGNPAPEAVVGGGRRAHR